MSKIMEPVLEVTEFDHPEHAWKWTRMELNFINRKLAAARQQGAEITERTAKVLLEQKSQRIADLEKSNAVLLEALKSAEPAIAVGHGLTRTKVLEAIQAAEVKP